MRTYVWRTKSQFMFNSTMLQKPGNWQPSWILAAILIFLIWQLDTKNCSPDPYPQISTENETFA